MAANESFLPVGKIDQSCGGMPILVRVIRMWEARNFKRQHELMSLDCLLLDEKDDLIQGSIPTKYIEQFQEHIKETEVLAISNYETLTSGARFKLTDHKYTIRFTEETTLKRYNEEEHPIQVEKFRFREYSEFSLLADKGEELPDVIGYLCGSIPQRVAGEKGPTRRLPLRLQLEDGAKARVTVWGDMIDTFYEKFTQTNEQTLIIIVTSLNPKKFGGDLFLNTTSATKFYLNPDFAVVRDFRERTKTRSHEIAVFRGEDRTTQTIAAKNISEILGYVSENKQQETEFICVARVKAIETRKGWNYIACSACSKKIEKTKTSLSCISCSNPQAVGILRFRIEMIVDDVSPVTTSFVLFDREANKLINKSASELANEEESSEEKKGESQSIPECVQGIVGRTFTFQIKVTAYNFTAQQQSFTVSRILEENKKESEETVSGNGEKLKAKKRDREGDQSQGEIDEEMQKENISSTAMNEDPEKKKIKKEDVSEDVKYAGLGEKANENGILKPN